MKGPNPKVLSPTSRNLRKPLTRRPPLAPLVPLVPLVPVPRCGAAVSGHVLPRRCATAKAPFIHYATSIFARNHCKPSQLLKHGYGDVSRIPSLRLP